MSIQPKILFVMPVLRTPEYTKLSYNSFKKNSDGHDIKICLDLDVEEDKDFYKKNEIPVDVFQGLGHWHMTCYYVKQILEKKLDYQYIGLIHNDMVFGYNWLKPFDEYCKHNQNNNNRLFCFDQQNPHTHKQYFGSSIEQFDFNKFQEYTKTIFNYETTNLFSFMPWVISVSAFISTFNWLVGGDTGIWQRRDFEVIQFQTVVWHFLNIACSKHPADFLRNQTTRMNWESLAHDPRYLELATYLVDNTPWGSDKLLIELLAMTKRYQLKGEHD